jgi:hypothetical protein
MDGHGRNLEDDGYFKKKLYYSRNINGMWMMIGAV